MPTLHKGTTVKNSTGHLPDDASIEDIQYRLYVLKKVRYGQVNIRNGKYFNSKEAKDRLAKWLHP